jgi:hypothetical protein
VSEYKQCRSCCANTLDYHMYRNGVMSDGPPVFRGDFCVPCADDLAGEIKPTIDVRGLSVMSDATLARLARDVWDAPQDGSGPRCVWGGYIVNLERDDPEYEALARFSRVCVIATLRLLACERYKWRVPFVVSDVIHSPWVCDTCGRGWRARGRKCGARGGCG